MYFLKYLDVRTNSINFRRQQPLLLYLKLIYIITGLYIYIYIYIYNTTGSIVDHDRQRTRNSGKSQNEKNICLLILLAIIHVLRSVMFLFLVQFNCRAIVHIKSVSVGNTFVSDLWNK